MNDRSEHTWVLSRFEARKIGLLLEEETRFDKHLAECQECNEKYLRFLDENADKVLDGHIPSAILARWDLFRQHSRGLERELLAAHIASCEECREDLVLAGFDPVMSTLTDETPSKVVPLWRRRGLEVWAVLATAAALALLLWPEKKSGDQNGWFESGSALPWIAPSSLRGLDFDTLTLRSNETAILLALRLPVSHDLDQIVVDVYDPEGGRLNSLTLDPGQLGKGTAMISLINPDGFQAGVYKVIYRSAAELEDSPILEQAFELNISTE